MTDKIHNKAVELPELIRVDKDKCVNCHACITACPVKYCNDGSEDSVSVNHNMCIGCGECLVACTHQARKYVDDFPAMLEDLAKGAKIIAIVAPSVAANFPDHYLQLNGWLKTLGVWKLFDVSFGAELCVKSYVELLKKSKPEVIIAQPCPAIVTFIEIYYPELLPYLAVVDSPQLHTIKMIREYHPELNEYKIAIISPCLAKKREYAETGHGDYNVGFLSINNYLKENNIDLKDFPMCGYDNPDAERAVLFSSPGGLLRTVQRWIPDIDICTRKIEGPEVIYEYLRHLPQTIKEKKSPVLIDCLNCRLGCNGGPLTMVKDMPQDIVEYWIEKRNREMRQHYLESADNMIDEAKHKIESMLDDFWKENMYGRSYTDLRQNDSTIEPNEEQYEKIFHQMYKYSQKDMYNCTSCGYFSCKSMAKAIFNGQNKPENCHFYLALETEYSHHDIRKKERQLKNIIETCVEGFVEMDKDHRIVQCNPSICRMLKMDRDKLTRLTLNDIVCKTGRKVLENHLINEDFQNAFELDLLADDETTLSVLACLCPIYEDEEEHIVGFFAFFTDITERKKWEAQLIKLNEELEDRVKRRTRALQDSLDILRKAQDQLIQSEKMASLGSLVAGVAHEINTPVGIGVSLSSNMKEATEDIKKAFNGGRMTKSDLEKFIALTVDSTDMILSNLRRASELVASFKKVAVDQSLEEHRNFNVKEYVREILTSLHSRIKVSHASIELDIADNLEIYSDPGSFSQILTNLVINSLVHGFPDNQEGIIKIVVYRRDDDIYLEFSDNGVGIPDELQKKVFDPFFTTKRGQGGSGLGLNIVYNLVTTKLGGTIECKSKPGSGTSFNIILNATTKDRQA